MRHLAGSALQQGAPIWRHDAACRKCGEGHSKSCAFRAVLAVLTQVGHRKAVTLRRRISEALKPAVDLVYPPRCPLCGDAIANQDGVCVDCWSELVIPAEPACSSCQRPLKIELPGGYEQCAVCLASPPRHDGIIAATLYNDASRKLILAFKHGKRIALADMLGKLVAARLPELEREHVCIPVPLHRSRLWMRGFNQAALLAEVIAKRSGQTALLDGLVRRKRTPALGGLGRQAREKALSGSIAIQPKHADRIKGAKVILVDDVLTSGATSDACVSALKRAGAAEVRIACFARVLDEALPPQHQNLPEP